jgi:hypothetical protein
VRISELLTTRRWISDYLALTSHAGLGPGGQASYKDGQELGSCQPPRPQPIISYSYRKLSSSPWLPCSLASPRRVPGPHEASAGSGIWMKHQGSQGFLKITWDTFSQDFSSKIATFNMTHPSLSAAVLTCCQQ